MVDEKKPNSHGGRRMGTGRKKETDRSLTVNIREDQMLFLEKEARKKSIEEGKNWSIARVVRFLIDSFLIESSNNRK